MKYHIFYDFRTSTPFKENSSDKFKDFHKLKLLTNFDINLTSFLGGVTNYVSRRLKSDSFNPKFGTQKSAPL